MAGGETMIITKGEEVAFAAIQIGEQFFYAFDPILYERVEEDKP